MSVPAEQSDDPDLPRRRRFNRDIQRVIRDFQSHTRKTESLRVHPTLWEVLERASKVYGYRNRSDLIEELMMGSMIRLLEHEPRDREESETKTPALREIQDRDYQALRALFEAVMDELGYEPPA